MLKIFFDGGCRPNPGAMEIAIVAQGQTHIRHDLGHGTSFDAEWRALIEAQRIALALSPDHVLLGDAATVVAQASGDMKCRGVAIDYRAALLALLPPGARPRVRYIKRTQNLAGIALERLRR